MTALVLSVPQGLEGVHPEAVQFLWVICGEPAGLARVMPTWHPGFPGLSIDDTHRVESLQPHGTALQAGIMGRSL